MVFQPHSAVGHMCYLFNWACSCSCDGGSNIPCHVWAKQTGPVTSSMVIRSRDLAKTQRRASFRIPANFMGCYQSLGLSDILQWTFSYLHTHARNISVVFPIPCPSHFTRSTFTQLCHTQVLHMKLFRTPLFHRQLFHTPLFHRPLFHRPLLHTHNSFAYSFDTELFHTPRFHTNLSNTSLWLFWTYQSSTTSFVFPPFPIPLQLLFLIIGRSWLAGLSGPLNLLFFAWGYFLSFGARWPHFAAQFYHGLDQTFLCYTFSFLFLAHYLMGDEVVFCHLLGVGPCGNMQSWGNFARSVYRFH